MSARSPGQLLPQSADAEQGVICAFLLDPQNVGDLCEERGLKAEQFHLPANRAIFEQLLALREARRPIDFITLTARLRDAGMIEEVGGSAKVTELFTLLPTSANARAHIEIVQTKWTLRETIVLCNHTANRCYADQDQTQDIIEDATTGMVEIAASRVSEETIQHVKVHAKKAIEEIEYAYENRGATVGLPTGFVDLDRMCGGFQKGFTYYVGGRPAMGKSTLGLEFAEHVAGPAAEHDAAVLFYSVEMTGTQLAKRLIFTLAKINQQHARDGFLSKQRDWDGLMSAATSVGNSRLYIDETAALTIADFRARTRAFVKKQRRTHGARKDGKPDCLIVIDYLQRMKGSSKRSEDARYLELQEIAQGISQVAKELLVPIIILAQLKRPERGGKADAEPVMSDFRECGDIEQEAHVVMLLHRPHYYVMGNDDKQAVLAESLEEHFRREAMEDKHVNGVLIRGMTREEAEEKVHFGQDDLKRYAKLLLAKQREGPVGAIDLRFVGDWTEFSTWDPKRARYSNNAEHRQMVSENL